MIARYDLYRLLLLVANILVFTSVRLRDFMPPTS
jgi:hypothetical protein